MARGHLGPTRPGLSLAPAPEDGVAVEASADERVHRARGAGRRPRRRRRRSENTKTSYSLRAVRIGASRARRPEPQRADGDAADALELCFGMDARADAETDEEGASVARVSGASRRLSADGTACRRSRRSISSRHVTREDALGENAEDARVTLASPIAVALSMDRLAVVSRVASRRRRRRARADDFVRRVSQDVVFDVVPTGVADRARALRGGGLARRRRGVEHVAPASPAGLRLARGRGGRRRRGRPLGADDGDSGLPRVHGGADFRGTRFFRDG